MVTIVIFLLICIACWLHSRKANHGKDRAVLDKSESNIESQKDEKKDLKEEEPIQTVTNEAPPPDWTQVTESNSSKGNKFESKPAKTSITPTSSCSSCSVLNGKSKELIKQPRHCLSKQGINVSNISQTKATYLRYCKNGLNKISVKPNEQLKSNRY